MSYISLSWLYLAEPTQIPVLTIATTIILVVSTTVFGLNLNQGIQNTTHQLISLHHVKPDDVKPLDTQLVLYTFMAVFTLAVGIGVLALDYMLSNNRCVAFENRFSTIAVTNYGGNTNNGQNNELHQPEKNCNKWH